MPIEITMPRLSDTMEQGTVVSWNVKEGDEVTAGEVLADIETDKATMELQNFDDGTVAAILLKEGQTVDVGAVIAVLAEEGEDLSEVKSSYGAESGADAGQKSAKKSASGSDADNADDAHKSAATATAETDSGPRQEAGASTGSDNGDPPDGSRTNGRIKASPLARKIAEEHGIDLASLRGTGPGGRIVRKDVEAATEGETRSAGRTAPPPPTPSRRDLTAAAVPGKAVPALPVETPLEEKSVPLSNMRQTIAKRLVESKTTVPHYQVTVTARMDRLLDLRAQLNEQLESQGVKLSVNDFLVRACALAMHQHPFVNSSWGQDNASIQLHQAVNVGVAIALPAERGGGLVVATLRNADNLSLRQISNQTRSLAKKAREKGLTIEEMSDSTFTISNLGMFGVEHFTAIINPPNAAILAVGGAVKKPIVVTDESGEDLLEIGHEMQMTISADHRVIDGAMAAEYLSTVRQFLETPATLLV